MLRPVIFGLACALALPAQLFFEETIPKTNPYTGAADVKRGQQLFLGQCGGCHGPQGEGGRGPSLQRPKLAKAPDDESLYKLIREGVPGTEMPGSWVLIAREVWQVAAFVRSLGRTAEETVSGDRARGADLYRTKGKCAQCHVIAGQGGGLGPELTEIGARRSARFLRAKLEQPEAQLPDGFVQVRVVAKDGRRLTGVRLNEDTFTVQMRDLNDRLHSFLKQDLKEFHKDWGRSPMPEYRTAFSATEMDDLVAYLASLRGGL